MRDRHSRWEDMDSKAGKRKQGILPQLREASFEVRIRAAF